MAEIKKKIGNRNPDEKILEIFNDPTIIRLTTACEIETVPKMSYFTRFFLNGHRDGAPK